MKHSASKMLFFLLLLGNFHTQAQTYLSTSGLSSSIFLSAALSGFSKEILAEPCGQIEIIQSSGLLICGSTTGSPIGSCIACGVSTTSRLLTGPNDVVTLINSCFTLTFPITPDHPCRNISVRVVNGPSNGTNGNPCPESPSDIIHVCIEPNKTLYFQTYLDANGCCRVRPR